jgi:4-aminobutyrate aminotransferase-like enzyme
VQRKCRRNGLLVTTLDTGILLLPALTIDRKVAERGLDILEDSI